MMKPAVVTSLLLLSTSLATADELAAPVPAEDLPTVAITVSPVHLAVPMAEVTTEVRLARKLGVAAVVGLGAFRDKATNERIALYEGGASLRYYLLGSFRSGLQLGAEALYVHASTSASTIEVKAAGLALSPFAGYKWTHSSGFTFDGQLGVSFMAFRGEASTGQMAEDSKVGPLLNLNVGYSF